MNHHEKPFYEDNYNLQKLEVKLNAPATISDLIALEKVLNGKLPAELEILNDDHDSKELPGQNNSVSKFLKAYLYGDFLEKPKPIKLKVFGLLERTFANKKMNDGSFERKNNIGPGLMAYKKSPKNKFKGNVYVIISPITYSGGSEFSNMMYSKGLARFIGQETGGGYFGNTSGYSQNLTLPNSKITIEIPALQFVMNVEPKLPFGSGVKPNHEVIPTINQYLSNENICLEHTLKLISEKK
jgi:hypothetical protein